MAGLLWYRSYMDSLANTNGYYPDIHAGHADRVTELTLDAPYLIRETPAGYNKLELMELVGGSVAWNQLFKRGSLAPSSGNGLTYALVGDNSISVSGTATAVGNATLSAMDVVKDHIYYCAGIPANTPGSATTYYLGIAGLAIEKGGGAIYKHTYNWTSTQFRFDYKTGAVIDTTITPQWSDLTQMLGPTIADYVYSLEQATAGSGIAWLKSYGFFTEDHIAYSAPTLQSVEATAHVTKDANDTVIATYPLDSDLVLRGIPKLNNGNLYYDGDTYKWDGTVTRKYGKRAYQAGDESLTDAITDGTNTVYKLTTPTTESSDPFTAVQTVEEGGTEEFVTSNNVPVGNVSVYRRA